MAGPSTPPAIRLAIVGCGGMARRHVRSFAEVAQQAPGLFAIDAVCDVDEAPARALSEQVGSFQAAAPRVYAEVARLLDERRPDAVDVVLPHFQHHTVVGECLAAGAHVLVEKPVALTIRAGRQMLAAAERAGKILAVAEQARRGPAARALHWAINTAGLIGAPRLLFAQHVGYSLGVTAGTPWRHDRLQAGGGWVLDGEVHYVDLLRYVFGDVAEVYARIHRYEPTRYLPAPRTGGPAPRTGGGAGTPRPLGPVAGPGTPAGNPDPEQHASPVPSTVEDTALALLTFERGALGTFTWTESAPGQGFRHRRYYGGEGSIDDDGLTRRDGSRRTLDELRDEFLAGLSDAERARLFPLGIIDGVSLELYDFLTAIRSGRPPEIDGLEALRDVAVCQAIYESSLAGQPVRVADVLAGRVDAYQRPIDTHWGIASASPAEGPTAFPP